MTATGQWIYKFGISLTCRCSYSIKRIYNKVINSSWLLADVSCCTTCSFSTCNKGNRSRLHAGKKLIQEKCLELTVLADQKLGSCSLQFLVSCFRIIKQAGENNNRVTDRSVMWTYWKIATSIKNKLLQFTLGNTGRVRLLARHWKLTAQRVCFS